MGHEFMDTNRSTSAATFPVSSAVAASPASPQAASQAMQELSRVADSPGATRLVAPEGLVPEGPAEVAGDGRRRWALLRPPRLRNRSSIAIAAEVTRYLGPWLVVVAGGCWLYNLFLLLR